MADTVAQEMDDTDLASNLWYSSMGCETTGFPPGLTLAEPGWHAWHRKS